MGEVMKAASFSLAEAKFSMSGDFTQVVIQSVSKAQIKIRTKRDNVAGEFDRYRPDRSSNDASLSMHRSDLTFIRIVQ